MRPTRRMRTTPRLAWLSGGCALAACGFSEGLSSPVAIDCTDTLTDAYHSVKGLAQWALRRRGQVIRCTKSTSLGAQAIRQQLESEGYSSAGINTGADTYVIAYRTSRIDEDQEGVTSALVYLPFTPVVTGQTQPLVVYAHDTVGLGTQCAPSRNDPLLNTALIGLVGRGFTVIAPDYAGYGYSDEPPGYLSAADEGHTVLDATRAARTMLSGHYLANTTVLVGYGQGGHAVLSAQSMQQSYGVDGELNGVATFAPIWFPIRNVGSVPLLGGPNDNAEPYTGSMYYFYSHSVLEDGASQGGTLFNQDRSAQIVDQIANQCLNSTIDYVKGLGDQPSDVFTAQFLTELTPCAATEHGCDNPLAQQWMPRFAADRPVIDAQGAPMVIWQGSLDTTVTPALAECGVAKISEELVPGESATLTTCVDPQATHASIVSLDMDWVAAWILARTTGSAEPPACSGADNLPPCPPVPSPSNQD
ncbi:MAG: lipase family protein [Myxococcales bacterium]